jgi:hypothetical protein
MPAEYLRSPVALDPLGAGVPGADHAVAIQQIDRVVGDRIDQKLEPGAIRQVLYGTGKFEFHFVHITPWGTAFRRGVDCYCEPAGPHAYQPTFPAINGSHTLRCCR